jgi:hypothetical protein
MRRRDVVAFSLGMYHVPTVPKSGVKLLPYSYRTGLDWVASRYSVRMRISANVVWTPIRTEADTGGIPNCSSIRICTQIRVENDTGVTTVFPRHYCIPTVAVQYLKGHSTTAVFKPIFKIWMGLRMSDCGFATVSSLTQQSVWCR